MYTIACFQYIIYNVHHHLWYKCSFIDPFIDLFSVYPASYASIYPFILHGNTYVAIFSSQCTDTSGLLSCWICVTSETHPKPKNDQPASAHNLFLHGDVIKWKHFPRYWPFVRGIHRWPVDSPHKGQWRGASMISLVGAWTNGWANNRDAADLRRHCARFDATVTHLWWYS